MKSQVNALLHVAAGIVKDAMLTYPALRKSLSKDLGRLHLCCQSRGLAVFTLDLPHLHSLLLSGLETGRLILEGPYSKAVSSETQVPKLFSGLWLRIFDRSACLKHEVDVNALFFLRSLLVIGKRIEVVCSDDRIQAKIGEYHDIERRLRRPSLSWQSDVLELNRERSERSNSERSEQSSQSKDCDLDCQYSLPYSECFSKEEHEEVDSSTESGGGNNDTREVDGVRDVDFTSLHLVQAVDHVYPGLTDTSDLYHSRYREEDGRARVDDIRLLNQIQKVADLVFSSFDPFDPLTFSDWLYERGLGTGFKHGPGAVAERLRNWEKSRFPNWSDKLEAVFPFEQCGKTAWSDRKRPQNHEVASRLITVPKDAKAPRLIAAEPTSYQWCQQLLLRFLFHQCRGFFGTHFIDFRDQGKSGAMVVQASFDRRLATVDLSDASDRLTCWTVERVLRTNPSLLHALHAARTRYTRDEISRVPNFLSLRKFASQGTATTFPVMSLVMLCIALGSTMRHEKYITRATIMKYRDQVRVFGDDIILPSHGYERLVRAMELLELKVNVAKSYVHGHFRESCGTDAYKGYDITPVKPRTLVADSPASCQAVVDTSNNLFNKGLWYASQSAFDSLPISVRKYLRVVGRNDAGKAGISSFCGSDELHLTTRWNSRLHRNEVRVWSISSHSRKGTRDDVEQLLDFFTRSYSTFNPRIVSEYVDIRKTKSRLLWEPENTDARTHDNNL